MLGGQKFESDTEVESVIRQCLDSSQHQFLHRAFRSLLTDGTNAWMNLDDMLKNETLMFNI